MPATDDISAWHPKVAALYRYWQSLCPPARRLPGRQHFNPLSVPALLPNIWLIDVARDPLRFRYRLIGTRIVDTLGGERTGQWLHDAHPEFDLGAPQFAHYTDVVETGQPNWRRGKPVLMSYIERCMEIERIFLPLAEDGVTVDVILAMTLAYDVDGREMG